MHVTNYAKLLFFINNLLSLIISGTDVLCLEELKPDLMVRVWERRKGTGWEWCLFSTGGCCSLSLLPAPEMTQGKAVTHPSDTFRHGFSVPGALAGAGRYKMNMIHGSYHQRVPSLRQARNNETTYKGCSRFLRAGFLNYWCFGLSWSWEDIGNIPNFYPLDANNLAPEPHRGPGDHTVISPEPSPLLGSHAWVQVQSKSLRQK